MVNPTHYLLFALPPQTQTLTTITHVRRASLDSDTSVGSNFATDDDDIIFVCFNYRLGALGWLGLEELADESGAANTTGNYGVQDQR